MNIFLAKQVCVWPVRCIHGLNDFLLEPYGQEPYVFTGVGSSARSNIIDKAFTSGRMTYSYVDFIILSFLLKISECIGCMVLITGHQSR